MAQAYIRQLTAARTFPPPILPRIEGGGPFFPAEAYHQDFLQRHPGHPYSLVNDAPEVAALRRLIPGLYRA